MLMKEAKRSGPVQSVYKPRQLAAVLPSRYCLQSWPLSLSVLLLGGGAGMLLTRYRYYSVSISEGCYYLLPNASRRADQRALAADLAFEKRSSLSPPFGTTELHYRLVSSSNQDGI